MIMIQLQDFYGSVMLERHGDFFQTQHPKQVAIQFVDYLEENPNPPMLIAHNMGFDGRK